ncbi:hypothetical protein JTB14_036690 [Gonioctena quinquepunctata]|nr:hypothetical protein JTB14_036690 [Gonioctena quinquepunctata]
MEYLIYKESDAVKDLIRKHFTEEAWEDLPEALKSRYLNTTRNYVDVPSGASIFPMPDFMRVKKNTSAGSSDIKSEAENQKLVSNPSKRKRSENIPICDVCEEDYLDFCPKCGMLVSLEDNPVPIGMEDRAKKTVPKGVLEVRQSKIHGFGVFALRNLKMGIRLGPYQGETTRMDTQNGYAWKLRDGRLIDASDETNSNYLRYVNCARNAKEQNVVAFQYNGGLYYRTCKNVPKDEELLTYYGRSFAKNLGIDPKKYFEPVQEREEVDFYPCKFCHIGLSTMGYLETHLKYCKFNAQKTRVYEGELFKCEFCKCSMTNEDFLKRHKVMCPKRISQMKIRNDGVEGNFNMETKKKHSCSYCQYKSIQKMDMDRHVMAVHEKENARMFYCGKCNYKTCRRGDLNKHSRTHEQFRPLKCEECSKDFNKKEQLDGHILKHHPHIAHTITSKIHSCDICGYKSISKSNLTRHKYQHDKENAPKFHCTQCEFSSNWKGHLKRHLLTHFDGNPYIDASNETNSNYLRYFNCARNAKKENVVVFQYNEGLYYRTCKNVPKDEELLTYYGRSFAKNLCIDPKRYFEPVQAKEEVDSIPANSVT